MELRVIKGLLASFLIHFLLGVAVRYLPKFPNSMPPVSQVEIEIRTPEKNQKQQQIVREALAPEKMKMESSEDPLTFLSKEKQRVKTQTQAADVGMTANRSAEAQSEKSKTRSLKNLFEVTKNSGAPVKVEKETETQSNPLMNMPRGVSTTGETMPTEVQVGSFTALNTDRYLYYSFFARVEEIIRYPWENSVKWVIDNTPRAAFQSNITAHWITHIDVQLKPNGEFVKVAVLKESGVRGFDRAAIQAFSQAKLFPNPPQEMIEDDGLIHLRYRFNVRLDPRIIGRQ